MNYAETYTIHAERALRGGSINLDSMIRLWALSGLSEEEVLQRLLEDLEGDGSIFGPFIRTTKNAATSAVMAAARQGEVVGEVEQDAALQRLLQTRGIDGSVIDAALDGADPRLAQEIEDASADRLELTWVCEFTAGNKVCHRCLPLHGHSRTLEEWRDMGFIPEVMHAGWDSSCKCRLVPRRLAEGRSDLTAPLRRVRVEKGSKRTVRSVLQEDLEEALARRDQALSHPEGRAVLRRLGAAGVTEEPE